MMQDRNCCHTENCELESSTKSQALLSNLQSSLVPETFCFVKKTRRTEEFSNVIFLVMLALLVCLQTNSLEGVMTYSHELCKYAV